MNIQWLLCLSLTLLAGCTTPNGGLSRDDSPVLEGQQAGRVDSVSCRVGIPGGYGGCDIGIESLVSWR